MHDGNIHKIENKCNNETSILILDAFSMTVSYTPMLQTGYITALRGIFQVK